MVAKAKKAGTAEDQAPAKDFEKRSVVLIDDKTVNGEVVRKIKRTIERELVDGEIAETVVSEKYVHGLFTINIPRDPDPKAPKVVPFTIDGTHPDRSPFQYIARIRRGFNVPNVPQCVLSSIETAIETRHFSEEKADRSGYEMKTERGKSYDYTIKEGPYWTRKEIPDVTK